MGAGRIAGMTALMVTACLALRWVALAQETEPDWQAKAGGKMAFEVASVKPATGEFRPPLFPLDDGPAYKPTGGRFFAAFPLITYIRFAYKIQMAPDQMQALMSRIPKWVATDRFEIEARAPQSNPSKDQFRLMMQSLLVERFHVALHFEKETVPALALVAVKAGKPGPKLIPHDQGPACDSPPDTKIFPSRCDVYSVERNPATGVLTAGSRKTTLARLAALIPSFGIVGRPVVDRTVIEGDYDFTLEWAPDLPSGPNAPAPASSEPAGPSFLEALKEQLGLKLESTKAAVQILVIDHVEKPSEN
ncbi:MAG TPA: TIGR03435 family protein [Bryobacteraceae bacterium]|jgi:uncharacterized protein (TIGR03435 family)